ncbi:hypothetical protein GEMRC1_001539 [Eukaryota sp. GEM-RC1]
MTISVDPSQERYLEEELILVDENDVPIGTATKRAAHLIASMQLHRAFSLFLFDSNNRLLMQKRAPNKATFPEIWANTCCSHPLDVTNEKNGHSGVVNAIHRKLQHELGIRSGTLCNSMMFPLTRILYKAHSNEYWGEHELDHCVIGFSDNVDPYPNPTEVCDTRWVSKRELQEEMEKEDPRGSVFAPWFRHVCEAVLFNIWDDLSTSTVSRFADDQIHRFE